jgi:hypothetical protein
MRYALKYLCSLVCIGYINAMAKTVSSGAAIKTLQLRLKDKHSGFLRQQACAVNFAWNFVNELSAKHFDRKRAFLSAYDMQPYTKGAGAELGLHSQTIQAIQEEYVTRRKQSKKKPLPRSSTSTSVRVDINKERTKRQWQVTVT